MAGYLSRCPRCGSVADEDAPECPRCGGRLGDDIVVLEPAEAVSDVPPPTPAPGGRRRAVPVRVVAPAVVAIFVLGVVAGGASDRTATVPGATTTTARSLAPPEGTGAPTTLPAPFLDEPTRTKLVVAGLESLTLVDLDASTVSVLEVPGLRSRGRCPGCPGPRPLARVGDHLVFQGDGATSVVPLDLSAPARVLRRSLVFVPSWREGRVWVVERGEGNHPVVVEVDLTGRVTSPPRALPVDWVPHDAVSGGLVLHRGDRFQVWDPATGRVRLQGEASAMRIAAAGHVVAWAHYCEGPLCSIHVTDVRTGRDRALPIGVSVDAWPGALSPDGRRLAFFGHESDIAPGRFAPGMQLFVVDVETGQVRAVRLPNVPAGSLVWSPSMEWLFLLESEPRKIHAYRLGASGITPVRLPPDIVGFALVAV